MISKKAHVLGVVVLGLVVSLAAIGAVYNQFSPGGALSGTWNSQNVNVAAGAPFIAGTLPVGNGGTGASSISGVLKGNGAGAFSSAASSDVTALWSGTCDGTTFLRGDGACNAAGTGSVTSVGLSAPAIFSVTGSPVTTSGTLAIAANGTSGGIPYFNASTTLASSAALTASQLVLGGGAGVSPASLGALGTTTTLLHGNAAGAPTFSAVALATDTSGTLPFGNGGTGLGSASDDTTLISSGAAWVATAVPSCANDGSHALVYDTSTNAYACATLTGGASSSGTFTATYTTGFTANQTQNFQWYKVGNIVTISPTSQANGTSNAATLSTASGSAPAAIRPGGTDVVVTTQATGQNNGTTSSLCMRIASNGTISWGVWSGTGNTPCGFTSWTASGTKLISQADTNSGQGFFTYGVP